MDKTRSAVAIFDEHAQAYQDKYMDISPYRDTLDLFCEAIAREQAQVLELACGPGNLTQYLLQQRPQWQVLGTDLSTKMIQLAQLNNPTATFELMNIKAAGKLTQQFHAVICGFGLPYCSKDAALQLIADLPAILYPAGVVYLSTMEDDYSRSTYQGPSSGGAPRLYTYYHEAGYLCAALKDNGFDILHLSRSAIADQETETAKDLVIIAQKQ